MQPRLRLGCIASPPRACGDGRASDLRHLAGCPLLCVVAVHFLGGAGVGPSASKTQRMCMTCEYAGPHEAIVAYLALDPGLHTVLPSARLQVSGGTVPFWGALGTDAQMSAALDQSCVCSSAGDGLACSDARLREVVVCRVAFLVWLPLWGTPAPVLSGSAWGRHNASSTCPWIAVPHRAILSLALLFRRSYVCPCLPRNRHTVAASEVHYDMKAPLLEDRSTRWPPTAKLHADARHATARDWRIALGPATARTPLPAYVAAAALQLPPSERPSGDTAQAAPASGRRTWPKTETGHRLPRSMLTEQRRRCASAGWRRIRQCGPATRALGLPGIGPVFFRLVGGVAALRAAQI